MTLTQAVSLKGNRPGEQDGGNVIDLASCNMLQLNLSVVGPLQISVNTKNLNFMSWAYTAGTGRSVY
jgi:hypothetical protein